VSTGTASSSAAADGAGLIRAGETILTEVITPPPTIGEAASGEVATANASSDPPGQEDTGTITVKTMEETSARMEASDPSEPAALSVQTIMSSFGMGIGAAAGPLLFGSAFGSDKAQAPPAPDAAAKGTPGEKNPVATAGFGAGSLSSSGQLQQEWADTASSVETSGKLQAQGGPLTLAELRR
jgi:hypothetical protein